MQQRRGQELRPLRIRERPSSVSGESWCSTCKQHKLLSEFSPDVVRGGVQRVCKQCKAVKTKANGNTRITSLEWWQTGGGRELAWLRLFNVSVERYYAMLEAQGGGCGICDGPPLYGHKFLDVDHDHSCCPGKTSCGKCVRGLLCTDCNLGLGRFKDSVTRLKRGISYLKADT